MYTIGVASFHHLPKTASLAVARAVMKRTQSQLSSFFKQVPDVKRPKTSEANETECADPLEKQWRKLELDTMHKSWYQELKPEFTKPYFTKVNLMVTKSS